MNHLSLKLGFWSALLSALSFVLFTVCFVAILIVNPLFLWTNFADYVAYTAVTSQIFQRIAQFAMLLFGTLFVLLLHSIYEYAGDAQKPLARAAVTFGAIFAALTGAHYFVQLTTVRLGLLHGNLTGLEQVIQANPYSAVSAVNMLGWTFFLGIASLLAAPVFAGSRRERVIRAALLANGVFCLLGGVGYLFELTAVVFVAINLGMGGAVFVATAALSRLFYDMGQERTLVSG